MLSVFKQLIRLAVCCTVSTLTVHGLSETNVLVVYNSENLDSQEVHDYYKSIRTGVLSFDLDDSSILPGTISYADFASKIRNPIRSHLNNNDLEETVHVIVLTKGLPHRIQNLDTADPDAGDNPFNSYYGDGNATFASVDSELTLLQFDLDSGEVNGSYDSIADNAVNNPYFGATSRFNSYSRSDITDNTRAFTRSGSVYGWWRLYSTRRGGRALDQPVDAGHIYLTARLDAETVDDVKAMIDRAQSIQLRTDVDALLLDSNGNTGTTPFAQDAPLQLYYPLYSSIVIDDYAEAQNTFASTWNQFLWDDDSSNFLIGNNPVIGNAAFIINTGPVAHLSSYGVNHGGSGNKRDYLFTYSGQLVNGASWIAYESYAAQGLGGVALSRQQAQVEEWIQAGGTFAMGNVWEPYTLGIPRSEIFLDRFLNQGFTYVEAAWASILQLSWQIVVIGDPLATATVTQAAPFDLWIFEQTGTTPDVDSDTAFTADFEGDGLTNGLEYTFDLSATTTDTNSATLPSISGTAGNFTYQFTAAEPFPENVILSIEATDELTVQNWPIIASRASDGTWTGSASVVETETGSGTRVELTEPALSSEVQRFYTLKAEPAP